MKMSMERDSIAKYEAPYVGGLTGSPRGLRLVLKTGADGAVAPAPSEATVVSILDPSHIEVADSEGVV